MDNKKILIAQPAPPSGNSPYSDLIRKYGAEIDFKPFFRVEPLTLKEFRSQHINILDHTAIVFFSRVAVDSFFHICSELRITVPETMKYFCQSEAIALYLQKYIVYRKRKIFFGTGTIPSILDCITAKHKGEKFLIACTDGLKPETDKLFVNHKLVHAPAVFVKTVNSDLSGLDISKYGIIAFYSPSDVRSLKVNFPDFAQGDTRFVSYGPTTAKALKAENIEIAIEAPAPGIPSIAVALGKILAE